MSTKQSKLARNLRLTFHSRLCGALGAVEVVTTFLDNAQEALDAWQKAVKSMDENHEDYDHDCEEVDTAEADLNAASVSLFKLKNRLRGLEEWNRVRNA